MYLFSHLCWTTRIRFLSHDSIKKAAAIYRSSFSLVRARAVDAPRTLGIELPNLLKLALSTLEDLIAFDRQKALDLCGRLLDLLLLGVGAVTGEDLDGAIQVDVVCSERRTRQRQSSTEKKEQRPTG